MTPAELSKREKDVVDLLIHGKSNKQMALKLGVSERTIEFHLNNIYNKMRVGSRTELILKLVESTGTDMDKLVESTVDGEGEVVHNGNRAAPKRAAHSWRNTISLIKKEIAMNINISFEELENYLRNHPRFFSLLVLLVVSLMIRIVMFELGLFWWVSYVVLGLLLGAGSIYFGLSWSRMAEGDFKVQPLTLIIAFALLPLVAGLIDQIYLQTFLRYIEPISITLGNISAQAGWLMSTDGHSYLFRSRQTSSDEIWLWIMAVMLLLFVVSFMVGKQSKQKDFAAT